MPTCESYINVLTVLVNAMLNLILIVHLGIYGAAVATAVSYFSYGCMIKYTTWKKLNLKL